MNTIENPEQYINDDDYLSQPKKDGERRMLICEEQPDFNIKVRGLNKKGTEVPLPKSVMKSALDEYTLDGEIIGEILYVFDILSLERQDLKETPCINRVKQLNELSFDDNIIVVETAYTTEEKQKMFNDLKANNEEGIVFKKKNSRYTHGRPSSGGNALKFKFQKTATFIVANMTKGKRSVGLELIDGDTKRFMGKVSVPVNHELPQVDELVEVQYLYCYRDGCIFQPVYLGKRNDSDLTDATTSQLIYKAEEK